MKFQVLDGLHKTSTGQTCKKGDIVESQMELDKIFKEKFQRVSDDGVAIVHDGSPEKASVGVAAAPADAEFAEYGNDVTAVADHRAAEAGLRIFHKASWLTIIDKDGNMVGDKKFRRQELTEFLNAYFEKDGDA